MPDAQVPSRAKLLQCPTCALRLTLAEAAADCAECRRQQTRVDEIPVLDPDPSRLVRDWSAQLARFSTETRATRDKVLAQLAGQELPSLARTRLEAVCAALAEQRRRIEGMFAEANIEPSNVEIDPISDVPGEGVATAYLDQIHRDWGWGEDSDEVDEALRIVLDVVGSERPSSMLVLGAGAARLPYEVHRALGVAQSVAIDINPLPFFIAKRLIDGQRIPLFEFPRSPRDSTQAAVDRVLHCEDAGCSGFDFLFADGLKPPAADGAFQAVLTPWFIDQVPKDLRTLIPEIHRCLADDGIWINHGPLLYHPSHTVPGHRYRQDEVLALLAESGFEVLRHRWDRMLYMQSPADSQGRTEGVMTFVARRVNAVQASVPTVQTPDWMDDESVAIPRWEGLDGYQAPHPMFAAVAQLIDGDLCAQAIATLMIERFGLPREAALGGVQTCLREIWRATHS